MRIFYFKHYLLASSHKHLPLLTVLALVGIANALADSFTLIYLLRQNFSYTTCAIMLLIIACTTILAIMFALRIIVRNLELSISISLLLLSIYYSSFILLRGYVLIVVVGILFGLYIALFWLPYHVLVMYLAKKERRGATVGVYFLIGPIISVIAPVMGGEIIGRMGYTFLFLSAFFILISDVLFIHFYRVISKIKIRPSVTELISSLKIKEKGILHVDLNLKGVSKGLKFSLFSDGVQDCILGISIPLLAFEFAKTEVVLGRFFSLFAVTGAVMTVFLGHLSDKIEDRRIFVKIGAIFTGFFCILASMSGSNIALFVIFMSLTYLTLPMIRSFLFTMIGDALEKEKKRAVVIRQFFLNLGRLVGALICIPIILLTGGLMVSLLISGLFIILIFFVR